MTIEANKIPFLAFILDMESQTVLAQYAQNQKYGEGAIQKGDIESAVTYLKHHPSPAILLVDIPSAESAPAAFDALADVCNPGVQVIAVGAINEYSFYCWLQDIGIAHYLLKPFTVEAIDALIKKMTAPVSTSPPAKAATPGKTIAVMGARGGVGASTVAIAIASILAHDYKQATLLIDLDPQQGTIALALDLDPGHGLREALEKPERMDGLFLERVIAKYNNHLSVIATEERLDEVVNYNEHAAQTLLKEAGAQFVHTVVDLPRHLNMLTRAVLKKADHVVLVTELNISGLRDSLRLHDFFRDVLKIAPPLVVANKSGMIAKEEMPRGEFEKNLGSKITALIPFDIHMLAAGARGEIMVEKYPASPTLPVLRALVSHLVPAPQSNATQTAKPVKSPLLSFLRKG